MSRKKFWAYLKNEEGQPIPSASITFKLNDTGQLAQLYTTPVSAVSDEVDQSTLTTDVSGFFQFFVGDVYETGKKIGYDPDQLFKLEWTSKDGTKSGVIDDMQLFYQIFPVDVTDQYSSLKNKLASNLQTYNWEVHRQQTWFHEIHDITQLDWSGDEKNDGTYGKVVSNQQMNYLQTRLDSVKASGADSVTIESSAAIARGFDIPSGSWSPSGDLYYYDITHNFDSKYPIVQLWCTGLSCVQYPAKLEFTDSNTLRVFVPPNERDGKHLLAISDISPVYVYQNPQIDLNLQELDMTLLTASTNIVISKTASAGLQTLNMTLNSTSVSATSGGSLPPSGFLGDAFPGTEDLSYQWVESYNTGGSSDTTSVSGSLLLTSGDGNITVTSASGSGIYQNINDKNFDIVMKINSVDASLVEGERIALMVYFDENNYMAVYFSYDATGPSSVGIAYRNSINGNGDGWTFSFQTLPERIRILRNLNDIGLYYEHPDTVWEEFLTISDWPHDGEYQLWVSATDNNGGGQFTANIDYVIDITQ